jgi:hypothetical protein
MNNFYVGEKVVCVDADGSPKLVLHAIYTIYCFCYGNHDDDKLPGLILYEVATDEFHTGGTPRCFHPRRFRPVAERKTDISIFRKLIEPSELAKLKKELVD